MPVSDYFRRVRRVRRVFPHKHGYTASRRREQEMTNNYPEPEDFAHQLSGAGGQHRPSVGVSTLHGETDEERIERLRRTYTELGEPFDEAKVRACYQKSSLQNCAKLSLRREKPSLLEQFKRLVASEDVTF